MKPILLGTWYCSVLITFNFMQLANQFTISKRGKFNSSTNTIPRELDEYIDWSFLDLDLDLDEFDSSSENTENKHKIRKRDDYNFQYAQTCKFTFDVFADKIIKLISPYNGRQQYPGGLDCDFELVGSTGCNPAIVCETVDLRKSENCDENQDQLIISDGATGEKTFCGPHLGFSHPFISRQGTYLFLTFKTGDSTFFDRLYKGFNCRVHCKNSDRVSSNQVTLPESEHSRKEEPTLLCGRKFNEGNNRIVGGVTAEKKEFPWQAALVAKRGRQPFCGASLINNNFILTAAHCVLENTEDTSSVIKADQIQVLLKAFILEVSERADNEDFKAEDKNIVGKDLVDKPEDRKEELRLDIASIFVHKHYNIFVYHESDVALIKLAKSLDLKSAETPTPVCLPEVTDFDQAYEGKEGTVSGWGFTHGMGRYSAKVLQKVELPIIPWEKCHELYAGHGIQITKYMLCAGFLEGGKDACQGDSGGPFASKDGDRWVQVGIVSFGLQCAKEEAPGVFVHVAKYMPWILHKTKGSIWPRSKA